MAAKTKTARQYAGLSAALLKLRPTREGFEGLVADLVEAASGGRLALMSSGDQLGVDGVDAPGSVAPRRAMQAKRYSESTALELNRLTGEMSRAQAAFAGLDCWILATTKTVMGKELEGLEGHAELHGLGFIPLDWTPVAGLPRLAVLCAAHPDIAIRYLKTAGSKDIKAIQTAPGFEDAVRQVRDMLTAVDVGFEPARAAAAERLDRVFSDSATARQIAGASPAFLNRAPPVARDDLAAQIATWWEGGQQGLALLGGEGVGKTWAALVALKGLGAEPGGPLTVVLNSKVPLHQPNALQAVIAALADTARDAKWFSPDPETFWERRMINWAASTPDGPQPRIVVLIDGLDERDPFDWNTWVAPLLASRWGGLFRIIAACRQDDWSRWARLRDFDNGALLELPVGAFTEAQRDAYLSHQGVDVARVSTQVLQDALHPRTAWHLARMGSELGDYARITREQILLRDFHSRQDLKAGPVDGDAFKAVVVRMAHDAHEAALSQQAYSATAGEVLGHAESVTGHGAQSMRHVLSELISGGWMQRDAGASHQLTFTEKTLPLAVGMALAHEIRDKPVAQAAADIDRLIEPWNADDLVEPLLRTCATALITAGAPHDLCLDLLRRWSALRFHSSAGRDFWRRLHVFRPHLFLELTESGAAGSQWLGEWGLACFWEDHPDQRPLIEARLQLWLARTPLPAHRTGSICSADAYMNRDRRRQQRRLAALERKGADWAAFIGAEKTHQVATFHRAVRTIGFLPRAAFIPLLAGWAASATAAGRRYGFDEVAALLRDNTHDWAETMQAVDDILAVLQAAPYALAHSAGALLLEATGRPEDAVRAADLRPLRSLRKPREALELRKETGVSVLQWSGEPLADHLLLAALVPHAAHLERELGADVASQLDGILAHPEALDIAALFRGNEMPVSALLRWRRADARGLLATLVDTGLGAFPDPAKLRRWTEAVEAVFPALSATQLETAASLLQASTDADAQEAGARLRLLTLPFEEQANWLLATPTDQWPQHPGAILVNPSVTWVLTRLRELQFSAGPADIIPTLQLLIAICDRTDFEVVALDVDWAGAFAHPEPKVQALAIELAGDLGGLPAAKALAATGWTAASHEPIQAYEGSVVLMALSDAALAPHMGRLGPENLVAIYLERPTLRVAAGAALWTWIDERLETRRERHAMGASFYHYDKRDEGYARFVADHQARVRELLERVWADKTLKRNILYDDGNGPGWPLMRALARSEPEMVGAIWRDTIGGERAFSFSNANAFPISIPAGAAFDEMRLEMLNGVYNDERLYDFVRQLQMKGHTDFLFATIREALTDDMPIRRAWALTVAGFLVPTDEAQTFVKLHLADEPAAGWLREVYNRSLAQFGDAVAMRHWFNRLAAAPDETEAWADWRLSRLVADDRYWDLLSIPPNPFYGQAVRAGWLTVKASEWSETIKLSRKALRDNWLGGPLYRDIINGR